MFEEKKRINRALINVCNTYHVCGYSVYIFRFRLSTRPSVAFTDAPPFRTIWIQQKLLKILDDDELKWLIAHEIGHHELNLGHKPVEIHIVVDKFAADKFGAKTGIRVLSKVWNLIKNNSPPYTERDFNKRISALKNMIEVK